MTRFRIFAILGAALASVGCAVVLIQFAYTLSSRRRLEQYKDALEVGDIDRVRTMVREGMSVSAKCQDGSSSDFWCQPLHIATRNGNVELVELLLDRGADPNSLDFQGETPIFHVIHLGARPGQRECIKLLLKAGADINARNPVDRATVLHLASHYQDANMVKFLLDCGADPAALDVNGVQAIPSPAIDDSEELD